MTSTRTTEAAAVRADPPGRPLLAPATADRTRRRGGRPTGA